MSTILLDPDFLEGPRHAPEAPQVLPRVSAVDPEADGLHHCYICGHLKAAADLKIRCPRRDPAVPVRFLYVHGACLASVGPVTAHP